jgi:hypothetical protein
MAEPRLTVPVAGIVATNRRAPEFPTFRLVSFWLGLPVLLFLIWAWRDSMQHAAVLNWKHGLPTTMTWPPVEKAPPIMPPSLAIRTPEPLPLPNAPGPSGESSPIQNWNPLEDVKGFDLTSLPQEERMPLSPSYFPPLRRISDEARIPSHPTKMQPYRSLGSKAGSVWLSSWLSADWRPLPVWKYQPETSSSGWLSTLDWEHSSLSRSSSLWIPYWLLTLAYLILWSGLLGWRARSRRKHLAQLGIARPEDAF